LNLDLEVIGRRPDGYHDIRSTFQTVELHDELEVELADASTFTATGIREVDLPHNSVLKAVRALEHAARRGLETRIHLHKSIPPGSGMGGASSDAACTLRALKALHSLDIDLGPVAESIGSDVPFFIHGGKAVVEGRGERVTPLADEDAWFAIAWPGIELSTKAVYEAWDVVGGDDLRQAAENVEPRLVKFARDLGDGWRMTGSGSAFFKRVDGENEGREAIANLDCWKTVTRSVGRWE
jgi:4-diphosphocytidyl-2-C-methyl-D-erythritol kinase